MTRFVAYALLAWVVSSLLGVATVLLLGIEGFGLGVRYWTGLRLRVPGARVEDGATVSLACPRVERCDWCSVVGACAWVVVAAVVPVCCRVPR